MGSKDSAEKPITVLDLFAGCGGLTEGFHQFRPAGADVPAFRSVGAVEWEPAAAASYAMNFGAGSERPQHYDPPEIICRDIVSWQPKWGRGEVDVVVGGPPCQGFSGLNRLKVRAGRNELWQEFIRVVVVLQPKVFVIENVDRFVRSVEFNDLKDRIGSGDLTNYKLVEAPGAEVSDTDWQRARRYLLNAADYGARQARRRAIVIAVRTDVEPLPDQMRYPEPTHSRHSLSESKLSGLDLPLDHLPWSTVDALFSETARLTLESTELPADRSTTIEGIPGKFAGPFATTELHITRKPEAISRARYKAVPPGGNRKDLRGRFLCRTDGGAEMIIEKVGSFRNEDGILELLGAHKIVENGFTTSRRVSVRSYEVEQAKETGKSGRSKSEAFRIVLREGETTGGATLEYLSTRAWDDHDAGAGDVMGRIRNGHPSVTIRTEFFKPEKGRYLHPLENRPITHYEAAMLQGFPKNFLWCGSKTEIAKQIGNAVPVPLAMKIAESVFAYLRPSGPSAHAGIATDAVLGGQP
ncbi:DNA cytosine methyltransferase [Pengzhenrongella sp.]|jgi:DNA-cytosine methyltransferase|uniref:DNA cytosine methyltransferase n=1 Tax=Pengzhenrongella sp. TaxID=2888820 RepID=UPI002F931A0E